MHTKRIRVPEEDLRSLQSLLRVAPGRCAKDRAHLKALGEELDRAQELPATHVPPDVVTLYSQVLLRDLRSGEEVECVLVLPDAANVTLGKISVVAPMGAAILGRRVGETVAINAPAGTRRWRIERLLYQPESAARVLGESVA
jgi:regulator of nucleoside diphosphate kinase